MKLSPLLPRALFFFLAVAIVAGAFAQTVATAPWFQRTVGQGVVWKFYQFDSLYGLKQSVSVLEADLTNPNVQVVVPYLANSRLKTSSFTPSQFPTAAAGVNGTFFELAPDPGGCATYLRINGSVITTEQQSGMAVEGAMCRTSANAMSVRKRPSGGWSTNTTLQDVVANGPVVVFNSVIPDLSVYGSHCSARHPRTAVGVTTNSKLLLVTVDGRTDGASGMTCDELANLMRDLGCDDALSLDGGGSTTMWVRGEENSGVVNYPSDNGAYDHLGERACSNGIAIVSPAAPPVSWDAHLLGFQYNNVMLQGTTQTVTASYRNIGTQAWTSSTVRLKVTRPRTRTSPFQPGAGWPAADVASNLPVASVAANGITTFSFVLKAPSVTTNTVYYEHFGLVHDTAGPFGPPDNEPRFKVLVQIPSVVTTGPIIIESRPGGQNYTWYSEQGGWADTSINCTAPGLSPNIGMRYGSTFLSVAESKSASFTPDFATPTFCDVYIAWGAAGSRRSPITYKVTSTTGTQPYLIDQTSTADQWVLLGRHSFAAGSGGNVTMSNEDIDVSGNMYSAAVKFVPVALPAGITEYQLY